MQFFNLFQAVWCSLADVSGLEDVWSDEACKELRELVESKLVTVVAKSMNIFFCMFRLHTFFYIT